MARDIQERLKKMQKKNAFRVFSELEGIDVDQFDFDQVSVNCSVCSGETSKNAYKMHGEPDWIVKDPDEEAVCSDCLLREELKRQNFEHMVRINKMLTERYWDSPNGLEQACFKSYEGVDNTTKNALYTCVQYVKDLQTEDAPYTLLLMGNPGTGKTHLSYSIAKYLRDKDFGSVGFITTGKLLAMIKETYQKGATYSEDGILRDIKRLDFLVVDDLGAEASSASEFSWAKTKLFEIVNSRLGKPTVYTTNFDDETIGSAVGERVASRLQDNTKYVNMFANDYRKNFKIQ